MSADNGVYILETGRSKKEFRVAELTNIEDLSWDDNRHTYVDDPRVRIANARKMFAACMVFNTREEAFAGAKRIYDEIVNDESCPGCTYSICEYGICTLQPIDEDF